MQTLASLLVLLLAYLIGSIPVGVLVGKAFGFDPRAVGSHNIGMTNVGRAGGSAAAALTFAGDLLKGLAPILIGNALQVSQSGLAWIALATLVGAIYSVFLGFSGGRGVTAATLPPARATLVIPTLPEPTARGSNPNARPTSTPTGIDPIK